MAIQTKYLKINGKVCNNYCCKKDVEIDREIEKEKLNSHRNNDK